MDAFLTDLASGSPAIAELTRDVPLVEQVARGYGHTLGEVCRQPAAWRRLGRAVEPRGARGHAPAGGYVLTGSGSSHFLGAALAPALQSSLGVCVRSAACGELLLAPEAFIAAGQPSTIVSFGRSGDSPESIAVVDLVLGQYPDCRHLIVTCNPDGQLATGYTTDERVDTILLGREVDDQSLVMTSSFTSMWLAGRGLAAWADAAAFARAAGALADAGQMVLETRLQALAEAGRQPFDRAVYLGSGARFGAAREAELKMLEMCAGRVVTRAETFLGLRHGPMACLAEGRTLVVAFLSSEPRRRAYEMDLLAELRRKDLGQRFVVCGPELPSEAVSESDLGFEYGLGTVLGDDDWPAVDVLVGQVLGFFRCLHERLRPDAPSADGVITRVVPSFPIHPV
ncbi:MAG: tagatose-6-phosphate ketose isomerase [Acidobacteria bacterium]|nr:tagatose-6-phosphate ketose isomerase [Acidobacteriota bacterium]